MTTITIHPIPKAPSLYERAMQTASSLCKNTGAVALETLKTPGTRGLITGACLSSFLNQPYLITLASGVGMDLLTEFALDKIGTAITPVLNKASQYTNAAIGVASSAVLAYSALSPLQAVDPLHRVPAAVLISYVAGTALSKGAQLTLKNQTIQAMSQTATTSAQAALVAVKIISIAYITLLADQAGIDPRLLAVAGVSLAGAIHYSLN